MQILNVTTLIDGSAIVELDMTFEEQRELAKIGILEVLKAAVKKTEIVDAEILDG